ncbi:MAG: hypothetical protein MR508_01690 [Lachnospiraceae bacterium]|nr:hypothetical protein [Lachnospiraceae bacterium]
MFRALEYDRYGDIITRGFTSVDEFVKVANIVLNRRKSRAYLVHRWMKCRQRM